MVLGTIFLDDSSFAAVRILRFTTQQPRPTKLLLTADYITSHLLLAAYYLLTPTTDETTTSCPLATTSHLLLTACY